MKSAIEDLCVKKESTIREVIAAIDRSREKGVAIVVDQDGRFLNTLTDGDVRRGILAKLDLEESAAALLQIKAKMPRSASIIGYPEQSVEERIKVMKENSLRQLPIINRDGRVVEINSLPGLLASFQPALSAVVMAGGFGKRLLPMTEKLPKPMLPVNGRPVLEHIVERLSEAGIRNLQITTHFLPEKIMDHFGSGQNFGVNISYLNEDSPLGTAGALGMMEAPSEDVLVINGDVLSKVDFVAMHEYHRQHNAAMTMGVQSYCHSIPYGVVDMSSGDVVGLLEKPTQKWFVNAVIYILSPSIFTLMNKVERLDMTDLIGRAIERKLRVVGFPLWENWIDIGRPADFQRANAVEAS